jgi:hypothetical protein
VDANAHGIVLAAASAGPEAEVEAQKLWLEEKPDEYFFLEVYASAVVEHLTMQLGARICAAAEARGIATLPHYSPGYQQWDVAQQPKLLELLMHSESAHALSSQLHAMESGMLRPKKSLLAVFGLTNQTSSTSRVAEWMPCHSCSLARCQYRRAPRKELNHA